MESNRAGGFDKTQKRESMKTKKGEEKNTSSSGIYPTDPSSKEK